MILYYTEVTIKVNINYTPIMTKREAQHKCNQLIALIAKKRDEKGITKYQISKGTGISESTLSEIDKFKQQPTFYTIFMITDFLQLNLADLIKELESPNS